MGYRRQDDDTWLKTAWGDYRDGVNYSERQLLDGVNCRGKKNEGQGKDKEGQSWGRGITGQD